MTATELQKLVLMLSRTEWVRYWLMYSYPYLPWMMAIECLNDRMASPELPILIANGFRYEPTGPSRGLHVIERTDEQGKPFKGGGS